MSATHTSNTTISGSPDRPAAQQKTSHGLRIAAIFTMAVTGPYAILFLIALFLSVALTGNAFFPDLTTSAGLDYAGHFPTAVLIGYIGESLEQVVLFVSFVAVFAALRAGARGYILKDADEDEILRAIQAVGRGEAIFSPAIAQRLIDFFAAPHTVILPQFFPELTDREREILLLIAQGYNNSDIARRLTLSLKTVANHVSNIFSKLQVADRAQAIIRAREAGLDQPR